MSAQLNLLQVKRLQLVGLLAKAPVVMRTIKMPQIRNGETPWVSPFFMENINLNKNLMKILLRMAAEDQRLRRQAEKTGKWIGVRPIDKKHTEILKAIIKKSGWPTRSLVGNKASASAWLIAQHADHDLPFQKMCLKLMKTEIVRNPDAVDKNNVAYLTDRILIHSKKKQLFGTQFKRLKNGCLRLLPIFDRKEVDKRRKEFGMESLKEYLRKVQQ